MFEELLNVAERYQKFSMIILASAYYAEFFLFDRLNLTSIYESNHKTYNVKTDHSRCLHTINTPVNRVVIDKCSIKNLDKLPVSNLL